MQSLLLVANFDSGVGYAWWLMESFWAKLAERYSPNVRVVLAYPSISVLPEAIAAAPLETVTQDFHGTSPGDVLFQCRFLYHHRVKGIYFSDKPTWHWRYIFYRLCGVRLIIVHDHTPGLRTAPRGLKAFLKRLVHRIPGLSADGAIGATEFVRRRLIEVNGMPAAKCFAAPNGLPAIDPPDAADLHDLFRIPAQRKILVMAGRAHRYKGVTFALQCLAELKSQGRKDMHFLFVGDGPDLEYFKTKALEAGITDHCTFAGRSQDVPSLLGGADLAIHPSCGEVGYSLSILEYMRAGLPVVVPDNPSVCGAATHGKNGMVYSENNVQAACDILSQLIDDDKLRTRLGEQALRDAADYSLAKTHSALLQAFDKTDRHGILRNQVKGRTSVNGAF